MYALPPSAATNLRRDLRSRRTGCEPRRMDAAIISAAITLLAAAPAGSPPPPFFAIEAVTDDAARFIREWERPGRHADLTSASHIARGASATPFIIFKNCRTDAAGRCDVVADVSLTDPKGKVLGPARITVFSGRPLGRDIFMRSQAAPTFTFDAADPPGRYTISVAVTDRVAATSVSMTTPVDYR